MKHVLVTGGAGFVGSNLVKRLIMDYGCEVTVLDNMFTGHLKNLQDSGIVNDCQISEGSVLDVNLLNALTQGKDAVFHLAAANIIASMDNPRADLETNIAGTFNVLESSLKARVERIVYASTSSVYGNASVLPIGEQNGAQFLNFYSASKYAGEIYAKLFFQQQGLPVTVVRYSNVYGYNQRPENPYAGVVAKFIKWALHNEPLKIYGDGLQTRDFTFIEDACRATILAALCPRAVGETYNVGTGKETPLHELARTIIELTGSQSKVLYGEKRPIDNIRRRVLDIKKARDELQFIPEWNLSQGLQETITWAARSFANEQDIRRTATADVS